MSEELDLSVVIPVYNEVGNVATLAAEVRKAVEPLSLRWELVYVDDGSSDGTAEACAQLDGVRLVAHAENLGQSAAVMTGIWAARGRTIVTLDGDGQNDPAAIPSLLAELAKGADVAQGIRAERQDTLARRLAGRFAYQMHHFFWRDGILDIGCAVRAFPRAEGLHLPVFNGVHRMMPALLVFRGLRVVQIPVPHRPRHTGSSKYTNTGRALRGVIDLVGLWWWKRRLYDKRWAPARESERDGTRSRT